MTANLIRKKKHFGILVGVSCVVFVMNILLIDTINSVVLVMPSLIIFFASPYCFLVFATTYFSLDREINRIDGINLLHSTSEKAKIREISDALDNLLIIETLRKKRIRALLFGAVNTIACYIITGVIFFFDDVNRPFYFLAPAGVGLFIPMILACIFGIFKVE